MFFFNFYDIINQLFFTSLNLKRAGKTHFLAEFWCSRHIYLIMKQIPRQIPNKGTKYWVMVIVVLGLVTPAHQMMRLPIKLYFCVNITISFTIYLFIYIFPARLILLKQTDCHLIKVTDKLINFRMAHYLLTRP